MSGAGEAGITVLALCLAIDLPIAAEANEPPEQSPAVSEDGEMLPTPPERPLAEGTHG